MSATRDPIWAMQSSLWEYVDSGRSYYAPSRSSGWGLARAEWCIALNSRGDRCGHRVCYDSPFCGFHYDRAADWFWDRLLPSRAATVAAQQITAREVALSAREQDVQVVLEQAAAKVYFLAIDDVVKIGFSKNVAARVSQLRSRGGSTLMPDGYDPKKAELLGVTPGGQNLEARLHGYLSAHRIAGEWFVLSPEVREVIDHFVHGKPAPMWDEHLADHFPYANTA